jgi:hypothetical protein
MKGPSSVEIWRKVKVLVIDEISMVDAEFLDWYLSQLPPHGIQLIFCGDFMQLPPVPDHQGTLDRCTSIAVCKLLCVLVLLNLCPHTSMRVGSEEHLSSCVAAARKKIPGVSRAVACAMDPSVEDNGWLSAPASTPFGLRETTVPPPAPIATQHSLLHPTPSTLSPLKAR